MYIDVYFKSLKDDGKKRRSEELHINCLFAVYSSGPMMGSLLWWLPWQWHARAICNALFHRALMHFLRHIGWRWRRVKSLTQCATGRRRRRRWTSSLVVGLVDRSCRTAPGLLQSGWWFCIGYVLHGFRGFMNYASWLRQSCKHNTNTYVSILKLYCVQNSQRRKQQKQRLQNKKKISLLL